MPEARKFTGRILVSCALKAEALPLARVLGLGGVPLAGCPFAWADREGAVWLVSSGVGRVAQAAVVAAALATLRGSAQTPLRAVNTGIAGAGDPETKWGTAFQVGVVCEAASGRRFYPDLIWRQQALPVAEVVTVDQPQPPGGAEAQGMLPRLLDMEASGFWQACQLQLPSDAIQGVKVVSDYGVDPEEPPELERMRAAWEAGLESVRRFIEEFQAVPEPLRAELPDALQSALQRLGERWRLTQGQREGLERILLHRVLRGHHDDERLAGQSVGAAPIHARDRDQRWKQLCHELLES